MPVLLFILGVGLVIAFIAEANAQSSHPLTPTQPGGGFVCPQNGHDDIGDIKDPFEKASVCTAYYTGTVVSALTALASQLETEGYHTAAVRIRERIALISGIPVPSPTPGGLAPVPVVPGGVVPHPISPIPGGGFTSHLYQLTDADIAMGPDAFAKAHGYASVDAFAADNVGKLTLTLPSGPGWPPSIFDIAYSDYDKYGHRSVYRFQMDGNLDSTTGLPTYLNITTGSPVEYIFPSWGSSAWTVDPSLSHTWINTSETPWVESGSSSPIVFGTPSTIDPSLLLYRALVPWISGIFVNVKG